MISSQDIFSYNLEQLRGDDLHNLITCVMNEHHTDVNGAMLWVEDFLLGVAERFHAALAALPQWEEPLNSHVKAYCDGLGQWVRALDDWSFESERYLATRASSLSGTDGCCSCQRRAQRRLAPFTSTVPFCNQTLFEAQLCEQLCFTRTD